MKLLAPAAALAFLATLSSTATAQRGRKPPVPRACGVTAIPLALGNQWTYEPVAPPEDRQLTEAQIRLTPIQPQKLVIKVTGIETKDGVAVVTLSEDHDGRVHETTIRCTTGGATFSIAPDAFWFAGEPGPTYGIELTDVERKGQTLMLVAGKITGLEWHDDVHAKWKHVPTGKARPPMSSGTMKLDRHWVVLPDESVATAMGQWRAKKLGLETTVNLTIEPATPKPLKVPPLLVNFVWLVDGVGPVQVMNSYGQMFVLTAASTR